MFNWFSQVAAIKNLPMAIDAWLLQNILIHSIFDIKMFVVFLTETTEKKSQLSEDLVNQLPDGSDPFDPPAQSLNQVFTAP